MTMSGNVGSETGDSGSGDGEGEGEARPRRQFDRHSGTGRGCVLGPAAPSRQRSSIRAHAAAVSQLQRANPDVGMLSGDDRL